MSFSAIFQAGVEVLSQLSVKEALSLGAFVGGCIVSVVVGVKYVFGNLKNWAKKKFSKKGKKAETTTTEDIDQAGMDYDLGKDFTLPGEKDQDVASRIVRQADDTIPHRATGANRHYGKKTRKRDYRALRELEDWNYGGGRHRRRGKLSQEEIDQFIHDCQVLSERSRKEKEEYKKFFEDPRFYDMGLDPADFGID